MVLQSKKQQGEQNNQLAVNNQEILNKIIQKPVTRKAFEDMLGSRASSFLASLLSVQRMSGRMLTCNPGSIIASAAIAASLDLPIIPSLGLAFIIPYKRNFKEGDVWKSEMNAQFQIGWKGLVQLAKRSGYYKNIHPAYVYENQFESWDELMGILKYKNVPGEGEIVGFSTYSLEINGFEKFLYMTKAQCMAHGKKYAPSFNEAKGLWKTDSDPMCLKTTTKQLLGKFGTLSIQMQNAMRFDQSTPVGDLDGLQPDYELLPTSDEQDEPENELIEVKGEQEKPESEDRENPEDRTPVPLKSETIGKTEDAPEPSNKEEPEKTVRNDRARHRIITDFFVENVKCSDNTLLRKAQEDIYDFHEITNQKLEDFLGFCLTGTTTAEQLKMVVLDLPSVAADWISILEDEGKS